MMKKYFLNVFFLFLLIAFSNISNVMADMNYTAKVGNAFYESLQDAINNNDNVTISLMSNLTLEEKLLIPLNKTITLNLNGKTLDLVSLNDNYGLVVYGDLILTGSGKINAGMYGIGVTQKGKLTIKGGTYDAGTGDYLIGNWGTTIIEDGNFFGSYCIVNGFSGNTVLVKGGSFTNKEETIVLGDVEVSGGAFNQDVSNYLASGKVLNNVDNIYYVKNVMASTNKYTDYKLEANIVTNDNTIFLIILGIIIIGFGVIFVFKKYKNKLITK